MKKSTLLLFALFALFLLSCEKEVIRGEGSLQDEFRTITDFTKVSSSGSTNVTIDQGTTFSVKVSGYANLIPYFETYVQHGELKLGYRHGVNVRNDNISVHIVLPVLAGVNISGSSEMEVNGDFDHVPEFACDISGSGKVSVANLETQNFLCNISGSGEAYAFGLQSFNADVNISGSGLAEISVQNSLRANISGSGSVYYRGTPTVSSTISGNGRVIPE